MKSSNICEEVLIVQEEKASHFHIWILPMHPWMEEYKKNVRNIKDIINYSKENFNDSVKKELLEAIDKLKLEFSK